MDGVTYTWDDNGNLLSDGVNSYAYDHANRLIYMTGASNMVSYQYNGLGDRLRETVNGITSDFTMDLNAGLTQALFDGTNTYLYGVGRIAQYDAAGPQYFHGDALGSVRLLTDGNGSVTLSRSYQPYGDVMASAGDSTSAYGFTGEWTEDYNELLYLRSRIYSTETGRYLTIDPSSLESNLYLYAKSNPINLTDPSGLMSGLEAFIVCFDLHSLSNGIYGGGTQLGSPAIFVSAQEAVNTCKLAYSKDAWDGSNFNFGGDLPTSGNDLFGWYIFERGNAHQIFDADEPLTKELSKSILINNKRFEYYRLGETPDKSFKLYQFNYPEQLQCFTDIAFTGDLLSVPISCVLGSFYYQIKTVDNGDSVGFRIDNRTDLESGTHIAGRFPGQGYGGSVEELLDQNLIRGDRPLFEVMNSTINGRKVVSILKPLTRQETGIYTDSTGALHNLGGGNFIQTYVWKEKRNPCNPFAWWMGEPPLINNWDNYQEWTISPY